jgi:transposase
MKYKEPTKGKGIRTLLRKNKFQVYLVDEHKTSCKCSLCQGDCEVFRACNNPRPWKKDEIILRHGLERCKTCKVLWNRDENSSRNMYKISQKAVNKKSRPKYLCRDGKQIISGTTSVVPIGTTLKCAPQKQKLHKTAKSKL